jgi:hypothetical protein
VGHVVARLPALIAAAGDEAIAARADAMPKA